MFVLVVDAHLVKEAIDILAGVDAQLGQVAEKALASQAVVVWERLPPKNLLSTPSLSVSWVE